MKCLLATTTSTHHQRKSYRMQKISNSDAEAELELLASVTQKRAEDLKTYEKAPAHFDSDEEYNSESPIYESFYHM